MTECYLERPPIKVHMISLNRTARPRVIKTSIWPETIPDYLGGSNVACISCPTGEAAVIFHRRGTGWRTTPAGLRLPRWSIRFAIDDTGELIDTDVPGRQLLDAICGYDTRPKHCRAAAAA